MRKSSLVLLRAESCTSDKSCKRTYVIPDSVNTTSGRCYAQRLALVSQPAEATVGKNMDGK